MTLGIVTARRLFLSLELWCFIHLRQEKLDVLSLASDVVAIAITQAGPASTAMYAFS